MALHPAIQNLGVLVKPASARCNLACTYCFYHERESDPYARVGSRRMSESVLERFLAEYLPLAGVQPTLGWQGGEPLLAGLRFFERMIELQEKLRDRSQTISHAIQTNGTLIDDDWAR
ncbi:MAG TPA: radical SAM protein, partial [Candidatus Latescibacteria bacterium]|nr:radical SAM protein [Candidatus Latescibacterota bacterium]